MRAIRVTAGLLAFECCLSGCASGVPPFVLGGDSSIAPAGPTVASLMQNIKCELWDAANDANPLKHYPDIPGSAPLPLNADAPFTLAHTFQTIEYIADVELSLDVTGSIGVSPSISANKYYAPMIAAMSLPATGFVLSAGAQLSEASHRYIQLYSTVDFGRLIVSEPFPGVPNMGPTLAARCPQPYSSDGLELAGNLGLKETLATELIAAAMNDVTVFPDDPTAPARPSAQAAASHPGAPGAAPTVVTPVQATPPQNVISAQIDFTVVESANVGPNWTLRYFKGPVAGSGPRPDAERHRAVELDLHPRRHRPA